MSRLHALHRRLRASRVQTGPRGAGNAGVWLIRKSFRVLDNFLYVLT